MYRYKLNPEDNRQAIPKNTGLPLVAVTQYYELATGEVLYEHERYPLCEVYLMDYGPVAVVWYRDKTTQPLDSKIYLYPGQWRKLPRQDYWSIPVYDKDGNQTNPRYEAALSKSKTGSD